MSGTPIVGSVVESVVAGPVTSEPGEQTQEGSGFAAILGQLAGEDPGAQTEDPGATAPDSSEQVSAGRSPTPAADPPSPAELGAQIAVVAVAVVSAGDASGPAPEQVTTAAPAAAGAPAEPAPLTPEDGGPSLAEPASPLGEAPDTELPALPGRSEHRNVRGLDSAAAGHANDAALRPRGEAPGLLDGPAGDRPAPAAPAVTPPAASAVPSLPTPADGGEALQPAVSATQQPVPNGPRAATPAAGSPGPTVPDLATVPTQDATPTASVRPESVDRPPAQSAPLGGARPDAARPDLDPSPPAPRAAGEAPTLAEPTGPRAEATSEPVPPRPLAEPRGRMTLPDAYEWARGLVRLARGDGFASARISLSPPELGHLEIRLTFRGGALVADIGADTLEAVAALGSTVSDLRRSLEATGVVVQAVNVSHTGADERSTEQRAEGDGRAGQPATQAGSGDEPGQEPEAGSPHSTLAAGAIVDVLA